MAISGENNYNLEELLPKYEVGYNNATRNISEQVINSIASFNKVFMSGAADLASSTKTAIKNEKNFSPENYGGRNICFGIREFAMVAIMNGMMLHKGVRVSGGGFMAFSDYFKGALRMSCLMELPVIIPLSHDSIAVGEDGPTHQPTEQLSMLRAITNMQVIRPCDANETVAAWRVALETKNQPTAIILTRQNVVNQEATCYDGVNKGAYVISYEGKKLDGILLAAGSEVGLAMEAKKALAEKNIDVRVVSIPSMNRFDAMSDSYKESVLPNECRTRLAIEMGSSFGWHKYVGLDGDIISVEKFGASAPAEEVIKQYGFTVENVVNTFKTLKK